MRTNQSKERLKHALLHFLATKSIQDINVKDLCAYADVHRSTFYNNYETLFMLLSEVHQDAFSKVFDTYSTNYMTSKQPVKGMEEVIRLYAEDRELQILLFSQSNDHLFEEELMKYFENRQIPSLDTHSTTLTSDFLRRARFRYHAIAGMSVIRYWLLAGQPCSAEELAEACLANLLTDGD